MVAGKTAKVDQEYDAVIVGASLAGCSAATLLGRAGARVALLDQRPDPQAYKRLCSHFIQSSAVPTLERLGLLEAIEELGGVRSRLRAWTQWGWVHMSSDRVPDGVNIRREKLDPLVRGRAAATPGVELMLGAPVDRLLLEDERFTGVETVSRSGERRRIRAKLVIGADGRDSKVAELAELPRRVRPHGRIAYGGYFEGPPPAGAPNATMWLLDPDWAAAFPTDAGLTFYACMPTQDRLAEFKPDPERALRALFEGLPGAPPIAESHKVAPIQGKLDMTNVMRGPVGPGIALAGDAALATDPLWGVGCGWAFQSAEWLADSVTPALLGEESLAAGLRRYKRTYRRRLAGHAFMIHDYATGRKLQPPERFLWSAAARDPGLAELMEVFGTRNMAPGAFMARALPRAAAVHAAGLVRRRERPLADAAVA